METKGLKSVSLKRKSILTFISSLFSKLSSHKDAFGGKLRFLLLIPILALSTSFKGQAQNNLLYFISDDNNTLYSIDRTNGTVTEIGATGRTVIEAIAYYPVQGSD